MNKKIYFLSDFHLGAPNAQASLIREKKIIKTSSRLQIKKQRKIKREVRMSVWWTIYSSTQSKTHQNKQAPKMGFISNIKNE